MKISKKLLALLIAGTFSLSSAAELEPGELKEVKTKEIVEPKETNNLEEKEKVEYEVINIVTATTDVNLREDASVSSRKLGILKKDDSLEYIYKVEDWYEVLYNNATAYVSAKYVEESTKTKIKSDFKKIAYIKENTYLYEKDGNVNKIADLEQFEIVKVYDETDTDYLTEINGNIGYINKDMTEDLTGTYVIVDISDQELNLYEDNKLILTSPVVTGKPSTPTSIGIYPIFDISRNRYLIGPNYKSYVDVMMKFNHGQGLHDAEYHTNDNGRRHGWRSIEEFGGSTYLHNGSHGCVNMPHDNAIEVYNHVSVGDKVLVKK